jgi:hypothetical protein
MDDPKLVETFSRRQINRLARLGTSTGPQSCCSFLCSGPPHLCRLWTAGLARRRS